MSVMTTLLGWPEQEGLLAATHQIWMKHVQVNDAYFACTW